MDATLRVLPYGATLRMLPYEVPYVLPVGTYLGDGELFTVIVVCRLIDRILFTIQ